MFVDIFKNVLLEERIVFYFCCVNLMLKLLVEILNWEVWFYLKLIIWKYFSDGFNIYILIYVCLCDIYILDFYIECFNIMKYFVKFLLEDCRWREWGFYFLFWGNRFDFCFFNVCKCL